MDTSIIEQQAKETDKGNPLLYYVLGVGGEAGEVLELFKKALRHSSQPDQHALGLEIGDVLWYLARLANLCDLTLEDCWEVTRKKLLARQSSGYYNRPSEK